MRASAWYAILLAAAAYAVPLQEDPVDDDYSQLWITVGEDMFSAQATSTAAEATSVAQNQAEKPIATKTDVLGVSTMIDHNNGVPSAPSLSVSTPTSTADSQASLGTTVPDLPGGAPALSLNGDHVKAPVADDLVPDGAAVFTPADGKSFNCSAFVEWIKY